LTKKTSFRKRKGKNISSQRSCFV